MACALILALCDAAGRYPSKWILGFGTYGEVPGASHTTKMIVSRVPETARTVWKGKLETGWPEPYRAKIFYRCSVLSH
jgi:hypothetical protein